MNPKSFLKNIISKHSASLKRKSLVLKRQWLIMFKKWQISWLNVLELVKKNCEIHTKCCVLHPLDDGCGTWEKVQAQQQPPMCIARILNRIWKQIVTFKGYTRCSTEEKEAKSCQRQHEILKEMQRQDLLFKSVITLDCFLPVPCWISSS